MDYRVQEGTGALIFRKKAKTMVEELESRISNLEEKCEVLEKELISIKRLEQTEDKGDNYVR